MSSGQNFQIFFEICKMMKNYTTPFQYERLKRKIEELRSRANEASRRMGAAAEFGDLPENSEFLCAADERNLHHSRLTELINQINSLEVISEDSIDASRACIGTSVEVENLLSNEKEVFNLVGDGPSDIDLKEVPYLSPLGSGLLGSEIGKEIEIRVPAGIKKYKILRIGKYSPNS